MIDDVIIAITLYRRNCKLTVRTYSTKFYRFNLPGHREVFFVDPDEDDPLQQDPRLGVCDSLLTVVDSGSAVWKTSVRQS